MFDWESQFIIILHVNKKSEKLNNLHKIKELWYLPSDSTLGEYKKSFIQLLHFNSTSKILHN